MKRAYVKAYIRNNLGDDLFLITLAQRYPKVKFRAKALPRFVNSLQLSNVKNASSIARLLERVCVKVFRREILDWWFSTTSKCTIQLGGSIFMEASSWRKRKKTPKNNFVVGANFGPWQTSEFFRFQHRHFSNSVDVCFRDSYSKKLFDELPNVRMAPDVIWGYTGFPPIEVGDGIGVSVIDPRIRPALKDSAEMYFETLSHFLEICEEKKISVKLFSFCEAEGDVDAIEEILRRTKKQSAQIVKYAGNVNSFLNEINQCQYLVATRFHAMIIGWALKKHVYPIVYSCKQKNTIDDLGCSVKQWDFMNGEIKDAHALFDECMSSESFEHSEKMADMSKQHFQALDEFFM